MTNNTNTKFVIIFAENQWMDELEIYDTYEDAVEVLREYFFENATIFNDEDNIEDYSNDENIKIMQIKV